MKLVMSLMRIMMLMIPRAIRKKLKANPLGLKRLKIGKKHPNIEMNLENLLTCMQYCGTCIVHWSEFAPTWRNDIWKLQFS
jgi:hypothetical protein